MDTPTLPAIDDLLETVKHGLKVSPSLVLPQAMQAVELALQSDALPLLIRALELRAALYTTIARYSEALADYEQLMILLSRAPMLSDAERYEKKMRAVLGIGRVLHQQSDYDEAEKKYKIILEAEDTCSVVLLARTRQSMGVNLFRQGHFAESLKELFTSESLSVHIEDKDERDATDAGLQMAMSATYQSAGDYAKAIVHAENALTLFKERGDLYQQGLILGNLGNSYTVIGEYKKAESILHEAMRVHGQTGNRAAANVLKLLGNLFYLRHDFQTALMYYQKSASHAAEFYQKVFEAEAEHNIGCVYYELGDDEASLRHFNYVIEISESVNNRHLLAQTWIEKSRSLFRLGKTEMAVSLLEQAATLSESSELNDTGVEVNQMLSAFYEKAGNTERALYYFKAYNAHEKKLMRDKNVQSAKLVQFHIESEQTKRELELQRSFSRITEERAERLEKMSNQLAQTVTELEQQREKARAAQQKAEEAHQFKSDLLDMAGHDLRSPLQGIMGFTYLVQEQPDDVELVKEMAHEIERASQRMIDMIAELLDLSAIDRGEFPIRPALCNTSDIVRQVISELKAQAALKYQTIQSSLISDAWVSADGGLLRRVFQNVISNSIKYSPNGTSIYVSVERDEKLRDVIEHGIIVREKMTNVIAIKIRDEGLGLSESDLRQLFQRFKKLSAKPTGGETSTGLGLALAKQIIELNHGRIFAESEGKGKGATFTIELPATS
jgi:signal transduction histidine kinase